MGLCFNRLCNEADIPYYGKSHGGLDRPDIRETEL